MEAAHPREAYRVVVHLNEATPGRQDMALRNIENLLESLGPDGVAVELVTHAEGIDLLVRGAAPDPERLRRLAARGVVLAVCGVTLHRRGLIPADLLECATVIPSATVELVIKQAEGWAYLRP